MKTNSPSDNLAGILSETPEPGPSTGPDPANSEATSITLSNHIDSCSSCSSFDISISSSSSDNASSIIKSK